MSPMSEQPIIESGTRSSPSGPSQANTGLALVLVHFWKLFAVAALIAVVYVGHGAITALQDFRAMSLAVTNKRDDRLPQIRLDFRGKQTQPATIVFKNQAPAAIGYLADVDNDFVTLGTVSKDKGEQEIILIPWENILYIRINTKESPPKTN